MKKALTILYNDSHSSFPGKKHIPQGGPSRFADLFAGYFKGTPHTLVSLFFSDNAKNSDITLRKISSKKQHEYFELLYPRTMLGDTYTGTYTKKEYLSHLAPWFEQIEQLFDSARPDVVFLNGYNLTNYILFAVAKKRMVPVCIQHAGIWKKELIVNSGSAFSPSIRTVFSNFEREVMEHTTHHIFLNAFSKDVFLKLHNRTDEDLYASSIIAFPISQPSATKHHTLTAKNSVLSIGAVARWDAIKNHRAILRLAEYIEEKNIPATVSVVTNPNNGVVSAFRDRYTKSVAVVAPMNPKELISFYRKCDVIILPSQFDVSPTVLLEATMQGLPVIISNNVGWVSLYHSLGLGELVIAPTVSGKKLFETIEAMFIKKNRFIKKMDRLQKRVLSAHTPEKIFPQYEKIFINLTKKNHD